MRVALVGSSSFESAGAPLVAAFRAALPGVEFLARGDRGTTVADWVRAGPAYAREQVAGAHVVLVYLGANDVRIAADHVRVLDRALAAGGAVVVWLRPPLFPDREMRRRSDAAWAAFGSAGVNRLNVEFSPGPGELADHVHTTRAGAARWVSLIAPRLSIVPTRGGDHAAVVVLVLGAMLLLVAFAGGG